MVVALSVMNLLCYSPISGSQVRTNQSKMMIAWPVAAHTVFEMCLSLQVIVISRNRLHDRIHERSEHNSTISARN